MIELIQLISNIQGRAMKLTLISVFFVHYFCYYGALCQYVPTWESIDSRPLPQWFDEAKFGIFIHWGVFSVPSFGSEWFWWDWQGTHSKSYVDFMKKNYEPDFTYADFGPMFKAEMFNPMEWVDIFKASGARYIALTSKHHEGFTNWPSKVSFNWNSMDVGPKRDLVGELAAAIKNHSDIHFGLYHSMFEWFHPLYLEDKAAKFTTNKFPTAKALPELYEIVNKYKPEVIWSDGDWEAPYTYWNSTGFLAWLYNDSPVKSTVVVNDRWGSNMPCHHGGYYTCSDRFNPGVLQKHKWESCLSLDTGSWGYRRDSQLEDYMSIRDILGSFAKIISCGGNLLLNIGPTSYGKIMPIFEERLLEMGKWLKVNGEAVYGSKPWVHQNDTVTPDVWFTSKKSDNVLNVYAFLLSWPTDDTMYLATVTPTTQTVVTMLGYGTPFKWTKADKGGIMIQFPIIQVHEMPCDCVWVLKFQNLA